MNKVEIIKIGEILKQPGSRFTIMTVEETDSTICYYLTALREYCSIHFPDYIFFKTSGIIRGSGEGKFPINSLSSKNLTGIPDNKPVIGYSFTIDKGIWGTSKVDYIISNNIIMTKNSVYAIHDISSLRDEKLKKLGIN